VSNTTKIYTLFKVLDYVPEVIRTFSNGVESTKQQVIKSLWESLRVQILQLSFSRIYFPGNRSKVGE
jgi:hypothetical protein